MDMSLYKVGANGRVALGDLAAGVQFFTADRDTDTGEVLLTPVRVVDPNAKRTPAEQPVGATEPTIPGTEDTSLADVPWQPEE